jgi:WD40 repeat protein
VQQLEAEVRQVGATLTPAQATVSAARSQVEEVGATLTPIQGTVVAAQARADSISLAVSADQSITNDNYDLALALSLESLRLNPNLTSSRSILNEIAFGTARFSVNDTPEAAISPAGRFFAAAQGNAVIVRDVVTREQIARLNGHTAPVQSVDFSPDGRYLASGSADSTVQVWDTSQWGDPVSTLTEHGAGVNMVRFSPATGNQTLFSTSDDNTIIRWSVPDGNLLNRYSNTWPVANIRFVGDGTQFFTEVEAGDVPILLYWAVSSTNPRYSENDLIFDAYNDDATRGIIADTASGDPLTVYNTTQRVPVRRFQGQDFNWSRDTSTAFAFSPNGRELLVGVQSTTGDNALLLLDIGTGSIVRRFEGEAAQQVDALAFNPSGDLALSASDRTLILWDVAQGQPLRTFAAHTDVVTDIEWSRDGRFAVSRSRDGNVRLWDVTGADEALRYTFEINTEIATGNFPGFNSRSDRVYAGVWTDFFEWSVQTGERQARVFVAAEILNMIYSRVQPQAITVLENTAVLWNLDAGVNGLVRRFGDGSQVFSGIAAYSPDGNYVAFDTTDAILVYNLETSSRAVLRTSSEYEVIDVAVMPGGNQVIASVSNRNQPDATGEIIVWETESESVLRRFPAEHNRRVNDIDINTDGTRLLTASDDNTLIIWSLDGDILRRLAGHSGAVNVGLFLPDGESVASASDDRTMILWDIESGQPVRIFRGSPTPITGFAVSPDGRYMATTSGDDSVRLWEITRTEELITWTQQNRFVRPLTPAECEQYNVRCDNIVPDSTGSDTTSSDTTRVDAAPQATATPLPTATIETDAEVVNTSGSGINIRTSDSTQAQLLTVLQPGDTAAIIGRSTRDTRWYQIRLDDDRIGWVRDDVISETGDVTNLPPVEPPPVVSSAPPATNNSNNQSNTDQANTPPTGSSNANLQVTGLNYNPNPPVCNQPFRVEVNVRNTGTESTTAGTTISVTSRHIASGSVSGTASGNVPALAPGEDWFVPDVFLTVNTFFAEEHEVIVTVDPAQQVTESNEGDNSLRGTYVLQTGSCG